MGVRCMILLVATVSICKQLSIPLPTDINGRVRNLFRFLANVNMFRYNGPNRRVRIFLTLTCPLSSSCTTLNLLPNLTSLGGYPFFRYSLLSRLHILFIVILAFVVSCVAFVVTAPTQLKFVAKNNIHIDVCKVNSHTLYFYVDVFIYVYVYILL